VKNPSQESGSLGQNSDTGAREYEAGLSTTRRRRSGKRY